MADDIGGVWRTIGGRRVFIKDGDDLETAMRKSGKFKNLKKKKEDEEESNPRDAIAYFLRKGEFEKAEQYLKDYGLEDEREEFMEGLNYAVQEDYKDYLNSDSAFKQKYSESFRNWKEANPQLSDEEIIKTLKAQQYNGELHGNSNNEQDNGFTMYNATYDRTVTVEKGPDGKWVDSDGNKYMGYLSKSDVKSYFKGDWKEQKNGLDADAMLSKKHDEVRNAKIQVANALGVRFEYENQWKTSLQLYREQKGRDLVETALNSDKVDKYNDYVSKNFNRNDRDFADRTKIDNYAAKNNLDADTLYYMAKISSEADRDRLARSAYQKYLQKHPNSKMTFNDFKDMNNK